MEKTQHQINETIGECLESLRDALKIGSKSRDLIMKLLQFEGNRIDAIENKIDLLMTERAVEIAETKISPKSLLKLGFKEVVTDRHKRITKQ